MHEGYWTGGSYGLTMLSPENQQVHEYVEFDSLDSYDEHDRISIIQARPNFQDHRNNITKARKNVGENDGNLNSSKIDSYLEGDQSSKDWTKVHLADYGFQRTKWCCASIWLTLWIWGVHDIKQS